MAMSGTAKPASTDTGSRVSSLRLAIGYAVMAAAGSCTGAPVSLDRDRPATPLRRPDGPVKAADRRRRQWILHVLRKRSHPTLDNVGFVYHD
jgi:hypothetical protein